jgi:hypothetical protein
MAKRTKRSVKSKGYKVPEKGFLSMVSDVKKKNWSPKWKI